jgi:NitT/TauT family transport system substrate-binding protein
MKTYLALLFALLLTLLTLTACEDDSSEEQSTASNPTTPITVQLSWYHEYSSSPFYLAESNGHFADANLQVTLNQGGFDAEGNFIDSIPILTAGQADFITTDLPTLLLARQNGQPVVAIAAITQRSPNTLITLPDSGIVRPQDLIGKTVSVADGGARILYDALLTQQGIDPSEVNTISRSDFGVDPLLNGEVDVLFGWIVNEGLLVQESGIIPNYMLLTDYDINTYPFLLATTEQTIAERPEVVQGFLNAMTAGTRDMIADPEQAAQVTLTYNESLTLEDQLARVNVYIPLVNPAGVLLGSIDPTVFEFGQTLLLENDLLSQPLDLTQAYAPQFVEAANASN